MRGEGGHNRRTGSERIQVGSGTEVSELDETETDYNWPVGPERILRARCRGFPLDKGELFLKRRCHLILFTDILQSHSKGSDDNSMPPRRVDHPLHNFGMQAVVCKDDFVNGHFS